MRTDFKLDDNAKTPISPEKTKKILKEHGAIVTIDQAKSIVEFLNNLDEISLAVYVDGNASTLSKLEPEQLTGKNSVKKIKAKNS